MAIRQLRRWRRQPRWSVLRHGMLVAACLVVSFLLTHDAVMAFSRSGAVAPALGHPGHSSTVSTAVDDAEQPSHPSGCGAVQEGLPLQGGPPFGDRDSEVGAPARLEVASVRVPASTVLVVQRPSVQRAMLQIWRL